MYQSARAVFVRVFHHPYCVCARAPRGTVLEDEGSDQGTRCTSAHIPSKQTLTFTYIPSAVNARSHLHPMARICHNILEPPASCCKVCKRALTQNPSNPFLGHSLPSRAFSYAEEREEEEEEEEETYRLAKILAQTWQASEKRWRWHLGHWFWRRRRRPCGRLHRARRLERHASSPSLCFGRCGPTP